MQQHVHNAHALRAQPVEQRLRKVQAGRRRRSGTALARIHGLIALRILQPLRDIRRQRRLPHAVQDLLQNTVVLQLHQLATLRPGIAEHAHAQTVAHAVFLPGPRAARRPGQALPPVALRAAQQQELHVPARVLTHADQACRYDARGVAHEHVPRMEVRRDIGKHAVGDRPRASVVQEQTRGGPVRRRRLRDQLLRQLIVKIAGVQSVNAPSEIRGAHARQARVGTTCIIVERGRFRKPISASAFLSHRSSCCLPAAARRSSRTRIPPPAPFR